MTDKAKRLEIITKEIEIHVVRVGGQKMTKATFRQIPLRNLPIPHREKEVLGWISDEDGCYLLWNCGGELTRSAISLASKWAPPIATDNQFAAAHKTDILNTYTQLYIAT